MPSHSQILRIRAPPPQAPRSPAVPNAPSAATPPVGPAEGAHGGARRRHRGVVGGAERPPGKAADGPGGLQAPVERGPLRGPPEACDGGARAVPPGALRGPRRHPPGGEHPPALLHQALPRGIGEGLVHGREHQAEHRGRYVERQHRLGPGGPGERGDRGAQGTGLRGQEVPGRVGRVRIHRGDDRRPAERVHGRPRARGRAGEREKRPGVRTPDDRVRTSGVRPGLQEHEPGEGQASEEGPGARERRHHQPGQAPARVLPGQLPGGGGE
mmetsp:Transcript_9116/g.30858  ORF Transcript_9116/g.30858 Transcript_9116/m.30858 type:complete len:270 (-) Transcript_9116:131-940(-)